MATNSHSSMEYLNICKGIHNGLKVFAYLQQQYDNQFPGVNENSETYITGNLQQELRSNSQIVLYIPPPPALIVENPRILEIISPIEIIKAELNIENLFFHKIILPLYNYDKKQSLESNTKINSHLKSRSNTQIVLYTPPLTFITEKSQKTNILGLLEKTKSGLNIENLFGYKKSLSLNNYNNKKDSVISFIDSCQPETKSRNQIILYKTPLAVNAKKPQNIQIILPFQTIKSELNVENRGVNKIFLPLENSNNIQKNESTITRFSPIKDQLLEIYIKRFLTSIEEYKEFTMINEDRFENEIKISLERENKVTEINDINENSDDSIEWNVFSTVRNENTVNDEFLMKNHQKKKQIALMRKETSDDEFYKNEDRWKSFICDDDEIMLLNPGENFKKYEDEYLEILYFLVSKLCVFLIFYLYKSIYRTGLGKKKSIEKSKYRRSKKSLGMMIYIMLMLLFYIISNWDDKWNLEKYWIGGI